MEDLKIRRFEENEGGEVSKLIEKNFLDTRWPANSRESKVTTGIFSEFRLSSNDLQADKCPPPVFA